MRRGDDVIYQGTFFDGKWIGYPDFLLRVAGAPVITRTYSKEDGRSPAHAQRATEGSVSTGTAMSEPVLCVSHFRIRPGSRGTVMSARA